MGVRTHSSHGQYGQVNKIGAFSGELKGFVRIPGIDRDRWRLQHRVTANLAVQRVGLAAPQTGLAMTMRIVLVLIQQTANGFQRIAQGIDQLVQRPMF